MTDWSPTGAPFSISARASASARLERGYRRLVACYPRSFRRQNTEEIIAVLLATAREGQRRPSLAEATDLLRGAARMRLGVTRSPWSVRNAVRVMYLGAVTELGVLITLALTAGQLRSSVVAAVHKAFAQHGHVITAAAQAKVMTNVLSTLNTDLMADFVLLPLTIILWCWLAWANRQGHAWARAAAVIAFAFYTAGMGMNLARGTAPYAGAVVIAASVVWASGLAATVLLLLRPSWPYYERRPAVV